MKITYDTKAKAVYIYTTEESGVVATEVLENGINIDRTEEGIVGIEILGVGNVTLEVGSNDQSEG